MYALLLQNKDYLALSGLVFGGQSSPDSFHVSASSLQSSRFSPVFSFLSSRCMGLGLPHL